MKSVEADHVDEMDHDELHESMYKSTQYITQKDGVNHVKNSSFQDVKQSVDGNISELH